MTWKPTLGLVLLAMFAGGTHAHHSANANYDVSRKVELSGTVVEFQMRSPHSVVRLDVSNAQGQVERWVVETHALPTLKRAGWTADTLKKGDLVTVQAFPNRRPGVKVVNAREFTRADGAVLTGAALGSQPGKTAGPAAAQPATAAGLGRIAGRWKPDLFPLADYDSRESLLPLSAAGRKAWAAYDLSRSPAKSCIPNSIPDLFYPPYMYDLRLKGDTVVLTNELWNVVRTVPVGEKPARVEASGNFGWGRAAIAPNALTISTDRYTPNAWGLGMAGTPLGGAGDVPSSDKKKMTERYSASADGAVLTVEYTVEDPVFLTKPYSARQTFKRVADATPIYPFDCDAESAKLYDQGNRPK